MMMMKRGISIASLAIYTAATIGAAHAAPKQHEPKPDCSAVMNVDYSHIGAFDFLVIPITFEAKIKGQSKIHFETNYFISPPQQVTSAYFGDFFLTACEYPYLYDKDYSQCTSIDWKITGDENESGIFNCG
jgi:hypothetical protein